MMRWRSRAPFSAGGCCGVALVVVALLPCGCGRPEWSYAATHEYEASAAVVWMDLLCGLCRDEAVSPPASSRLCACTGVALYEVVAGGMPGRASLAGRLKGVLEVPQPEPGSRYDWPSCATSALSTTVTGLLDAVSARTLAAIEELRISQLAARRVEGVPLDVLERSMVYGDSVARSVLAWADADGYREASRMECGVPAGQGSAPDIEPCWSTLRPYVIEPDDLRLPSALPEDLDDPGSHAIREARAVDVAAKRVDVGQAGDRIPVGERDSCDWLSIENQLAKAMDLRLDEAAEMYALAGVAMADANILCWTEESRSGLLREVDCADRDAGTGRMPATPASRVPDYVSVDSVVTGTVSAVISWLLGEEGLSGEACVGMGSGCHSGERTGAEATGRSPFDGSIASLMAVDEAIERGRCIGRLVINRLCPRYLADAHLAKPRGAGARETSFLGQACFLDPAFPPAPRISLPIRGTC